MRSMLCIGARQAEMNMLCHDISCGNKSGAAAFLFQQIGYKAVYDY